MSLKRLEMFEKYKEEHSEFKDAKFGNIKKDTGCDELLVVPNEDGYIFHYILFNVITAKVFYNKQFEIHNEKGPAAIETSFVIGCKGKISVFSNKEKFSSGIFLYYRDAVGILSKRIKRVNPKVFEKGHEVWGEIIRNPLRIFLIFPFLWYIILLVWTKLFKKD